MSDKAFPIAYAVEAKHRDPGHLAERVVRRNAYRIVMAMSPSNVDALAKSEEERERTMMRLREITTEQGDLLRDITKR